MLFSKKSFIDDIKKSFDEYSLTVDDYSLSKNGDTIHLKMHDSLNNTDYFAIAVKNPCKKDSINETWQNTLDNDFLNSLISYDKLGITPPAAIIVPSQDIDIVKEIAIQKGINFTTYELFEGYTVLALRKKDVETFLSHKFEPQLNAVSPLDTVEISQKTDDTIDEKNNHIKKSGKFIDKLDFALIKKIFTAGLIGISLALAVAMIYILFNDTEPTNTTYKNIMQKTKAIYIDEIKIGRSENTDIKKALLSHPKISKTLLASPDNIEELYEIVKNPLAPALMLKNALTSDDNILRSSLALNKNLPPEYYTKLANDEYEIVRANLATNPSIDKKIMTLLLKDTTIVKDSLLENSQLTDDIIDIISRDSKHNCDFNKKLMASPSLLNTTIRTYENNSDPCIRVGIATNLNTPTDIINRYTKDTNHDVRIAALKNSNISEDLLREYFNEPHSDNINDILTERLAILTNPKTPKDILEQAILNDPYLYGKSVAQNNATPKELINNLTEFAIQKKGLQEFLNEAYNISSNIEILTSISTQMKRNKSSLTKALKQQLNKMFIDHVYDPNIMNDILQRYDIYMNAISLKPLSDKNMGKDKLRFNDINISLADIDNIYNLPLNFADNDELRNIVKNNNNATTTTDVAINLADNIVYDTFRNILPDIEKSLLMNNLATDNDLVSHTFDDNPLTTKETLYKTFSNKIDTINKFLDE